MVIQPKRPPKYGADKVKYGLTSFCRSGAAGAQQLEYGTRQLGEGADDPVGRQFAHWGGGVAIVDGNDGNSRRAGGRNVAEGIPDHHGVSGLAARTANSPSQQIRMRLLQPKRVCPANGDEAIGQAKRVKEPHGEPFELVGADSKTAAAGGELVERCFEA